MWKRKISSAEKIAYTALLVAMQVVLGNLLQIPLDFKQFNFGFLPVAVAGALLGPVPAMVVGGLGDFFSAHLFPVGAYFFGFTLTYVLVGLLYGLGLHKQKPGIWRAAVISGLVAACNLFLNSYWLSILYGSRAYWGWVASRWWTYLPEWPVHTALIALTLHGLGRAKHPAFAALTGHAEPKQAEKETPKA